MTSHSNIRAPLQPWPLAMALPSPALKLKKNNPHLSGSRTTLVVSGFSSPSLWKTPRDKIRGGG